MMLNGALVFVAVQIGWLAHSEESTLPSILIAIPPFKGGKGDFGAGYLLSAYFNDVKWSLSVCRRTDRMVSSFRRKHPTIDFNSDSPFQGGKGDFGAGYLLSAYFKKRISHKGTYLF